MNGGATLSHHGIIDPDLFDLLGATSRASGPPPPSMQHTQPGFFASSGSAVIANLCFKGDCASRWDRRGLHISPVQRRH